MAFTFWLNGAEMTAAPGADETMYTYLRSVGCYSVKCGCETTNCGLCTVWMDGIPVLSCSVPAMRMEGKRITTLEGLQTEAAEFGRCLAEEGGDQCGFCNPGFIMNVLAMLRELDDPTDEEIKTYLAGNLCRCTGYHSHLRAIRRYMTMKKEEQK